LSKTKKAFTSRLTLPARLPKGFEMAKEDLRNRQQKLESDKDPGLCPWQYKVWARGLEGRMVVAATWNVSDL
jgi:hypothetical protein